MSESTNATTAASEVLKKVLDNLHDRKGTLLVAYFALLLALFAAATIFGGKIGAFLILVGLVPAIIFLTVELAAKRKAAVLGTVTLDKKRSILAERMIAISATLALGTFVYASHKAEVLGVWLPGVYPATAGKILLNEHHEALRGLLSAKTDEDRLKYFSRWLETQTTERQNRRTLIPFARQVKLLPSGLKTPPSILDEKIRVDDVAMKKIANAFRAAYKGSCTLSVLSLTHLGKTSPSSDSEEWLFFVQYEGQYAIDRFFEDSRLGDVSKAVLFSDSPQRQDFFDRFKYYFPDADLELLARTLPDQKMSTVRNRNAFEVLAFQTGAAIELEPNTQVFGYEISSGKMVLQKQSGNLSWWKRMVENPWRISEIAPYSIFRTQKGSPTSVEPQRLDDWVRLQDVVSYVSQEDETLCQSAALQMTLATINPNFQQDQRDIRSVLNAHRDGPLSHEARKEFAATQCLQYRWENRYERNIENVVRAIRTQLKRGVPVSISTRFTPSGHVIVVTGIGRDTSGKWLVEAHDPAGSFDFYRRRFNGSGAGVRYELSKLSIRTQRWSNGTKKELAFFVVGEECWFPPLRTLAESGFQPIAESDMDWEWLAAEEVEK